MTEARRERIECADGSVTLYSQQFDAHYHSIHGAITESNHVFIDSCLAIKAKEKQELSIFEMGFGTGLNALLTMQYANNHNLQINYVAVEAYPLTISEIRETHFDELLSIDQVVLEDIHTKSQNQVFQVSPFFNLTVLHQRLEDVEFQDYQFDCIYYDAFAPSAQPELWTPTIFKKLYDGLNKSGILTTYCAKGQVKRDLKSVGFELESIPGPPGKREMTRVYKR